MAQARRPSILPLWTVVGCLLFMVLGLILRELVRKHCSPEALYFRTVLSQELRPVLEEGVIGQSSPNDRPISWWSYIALHLMVDNRRANGTLNLESPEIEDASEWGQGKRVLEILNFQRNGTYVEVGAYDGEFFSNTLMMETKYGWTGVLVETVPNYFKKMLTKNRKACMVNACVSSRPWNKKATLRINQAGDPYSEVSSALDGFLPVFGIEPIRELEVDCFPLFDILYACGVTRSIDVMFIDIQGAELHVLLSMPWHFINVKVIIAEVSSLFRVRGLDEPERILQNMKNLLDVWGYELHSNVKMDYIFVRRIHL